MPLHFCPECGSKLQPGFKFCPSCGEKLPCLLEVPHTHHTHSTHSTHSEAPEEPETVSKLSSRMQTQSIRDVCEGVSPALSPAVSSASSSAPALIRSPIKSTLRSSVRKSCSVSTPPKPAANNDPNSLATLSPRKRKAPLETKVEDERPGVVPQTPQTPQTPPSGKAKRTKRASAVEPVPDGLEVYDQSGKKWTLGGLLSQTEVELMYAVQQVGVRSSSNSDSKHIMRLGAKDGQLFNEQNFLQRAAKPTAVEKWMKTHGLDFLGIPSCVGFGLHETYRFLIFPDMGCTLQSALDTQTRSLSEREVLQLALPLLDALEFIHENEYVHADVHAGNVYISPLGDSQVFLSGFGHAFRFCPGGKHVEYREGGRTPHQGNLNFISVDSHKGAGPSRRSDLQSLGFCLLFWLSGSLPWSPAPQTGSAVSAQKERYMADIPGLMRHCFSKKKVSGALQTYLAQVMSLQYTEKPDYSALRLGLRDQFGGSL